MCASQGPFPFVSENPATARWLPYGGCLSIPVAITDVFAANGAKPAIRHEMSERDAKSQRQAPAASPRIETSTSSAGEYRSVMYLARQSAWV